MLVVVAVDEGEAGDEAKVEFTFVKVSDNDGLGDFSDNFEGVEISDEALPSVIEVV